MLAGVASLAIALLMLAAMLGTLFEKDLVFSVTQQGWGRELYGISAALTKLRFGIGGFAVDTRIFDALMRGGLTGAPDVSLGREFPNNLRDPKLLQNALRLAESIDVPPPGDRELTGFSGDDTGLAIYNYWAFIVFGVNIPALTYTYFAVLLVSLGLYTISHRHNVAAMIAAALLTTSLYVIVCAPTVNFEGAGIDVKDPRFLGTLAALPLLHVVVLWMQRDHQLRILDYGLLALQSVIFAFATLIRSPTLWAALALPALWIMLAAAAAWRRRGSLRLLYSWWMPRSVFSLGMVLLVLFAVQVFAKISEHPLYGVEGDIARHTFWQGVLYSLQLHPEWQTKYGTLANGATGDAMSETVALMAVMKLPPEERRQYLKSDGVTMTRTAVEKFTRIAFFDLLRRDSDFILQTFFVIKPTRLLESESSFLHSLFAGLPARHYLLPLVALLIMACLAAGDSQALRVLLSLGGAALWFALIAMLPNWLVSINPLVMIDHFAWLLFLIGACAIVLAAGSLRITRRSPASG